MTGEQALARIRSTFEQKIAETPSVQALIDKINAGKATFADTDLYARWAAINLGMCLSDTVCDIDPEDRPAVCRALLFDRYEDINGFLAQVQAELDSRFGIRIGAKKATFPEERVSTIGHSLADPDKPDEVIRRRARSTSTVAMSFHDDYMKTNAKHRARLGLKCYITRKTDGKCCPWCTKLAGRYVYGEEPEDVYHRHDNCGCSVTYENGRERTDVWSKRTWTVDPKTVHGFQPTVLTQEQAVELEAKHLPIINQSRGTRLFNDYGVSSNAPINSQSIIEDLKSSSIGREILEYIGETEEIFIRLDNSTVRTDSSGRPIFGEEKGGEIIVYLLMCEDSERAARTVIHECTHRRYGIGQSQWAECVCFAQELQHKYKRDALTYSEKKRIIEAVQEGYPEYKWRKGGLIYGERQNHT